MPFANIRQVTWKEIRSRISKVNPIIADAIDAIPYTEHPALYLASYPFGERIVDQGLMRIPEQNAFHVLHSSDLSPELTKEFSYSNIPLFLTLSKTMELFLEVNGRTYPLHLFQPGKIFGSWSILDAQDLQDFTQPGTWSIVAGTRTIFMQPKVMDYSSHSKMQRQLHLQEAYPPHNLFDQGVVFADIVASTQIQCDWQQDIVIFGKDWAQGLQQGQWPALYHALLQGEWNESKFLRNLTNIETLWQPLAQAQAQTRLKPSLYVMDTIKHLIHIATNNALGFAPLSVTDDVVAPVATIQQAYLEYYNLKQYIPTLLAPAYLKNHTALYYSFLYPTLLSLSPNYNFRNTLEDERNIKHVLELVQNVLTEYRNYESILSPEIQFDFFHYEADPVYGIHSVQELAKADPLLNHYPTNPDLIFSENGPFLRACVRIQNPSNIR